MDLDKYVFKRSLSEYVENHVKFVELVILPEYTPQSAYLEVYKCKPKAASKRANNLLNTEKIQDLVYHYRMMNLKEHNVSYYGQIQKLQEIYQLCLSEGKFKDALNAIGMINKMMGYDIHRVDVTSGGESISINYIPPVYEVPEGEPKVTNYLTGNREEWHKNNPNKEEWESVKNSRQDYYDVENARIIEEVKAEDEKVANMTKAKRKEYLENKSREKNESNKK